MNYLHPNWSLSKHPPGIRKQQRTAWLLESIAELSIDEDVKTLAAKLIEGGGIHLPGNMHSYGAI